MNFLANPIFRESPFHTLSSYSYTLEEKGGMPSGHENMPLGSPTRESVLVKSPSCYAVVYMKATLRMDLSWPMTQGFRDIDENLLLGVTGLLS